jgi:hypothetical protein
VAALFLPSKGVQPPTLLVQALQCHLQQVQPPCRAPRRSWRLLLDLAPVPGLERQCRCQAHLQPLLQSSLRMTTLAPEALSHTPPPSFQSISDLCRPPPTSTLAHLLDWALAPFFRELSQIWSLRVSILLHSGQPRCNRVFLPCLLFICQLLATLLKYVNNVLFISFIITIR